MKASYFRLILYRTRKLIWIWVTLVAAAEPMLAVEGGLGRTLPGAWVLPQGAVVGPEPGFSFTTLAIGYMGSIGGARLDPIAGQIYEKAEVNISETLLIPQYVYKTETRKISLASSFMGVVNWVGASGSLQFESHKERMNSANAGAGDMIAVPLTVGIHFSENNNLAISTWFFPPTGQFTKNNLSNLGMGLWTIMPNVAHTLMWKKRRLEFDTFMGFDIYRHNQTTNYTSGTVFHWETMAIHHLSKKVGFGAIGSNVTQITNDSGPLADSLHGFQGRAWGVGPIVLYVAKVQKPEVVLHLRWVDQFRVTNLMKGSTLLFGLTVTLN